MFVSCARRATEAASWEGGKPKRDVASADRGRTRSARSRDREGKAACCVGHSEDAGGKESVRRNSHAGDVTNANREGLPDDVVPRVRLENAASVKAPGVTRRPVAIENDLKDANQRRMIGVEAAPGGRRKVIPCHVGSSNIDATIGNDVLGVVDPSVARELAVRVCGTVPAGHNELFDLELAGPHKAIGTASVGGFLQSDEQGLDEPGSVGPLAHEQAHVHLARQGG